MVLFISIQIVTYKDMINPMVNPIFGKEIFKQFSKALFLLVFTRVKDFGNTLIFNTCYSTRVPRNISRFPGGPGKRSTCSPKL